MAADGQRMLDISIEGLPEHASVAEAVAHLEALAAEQLCEQHDSSAVRGLVVAVLLRMFCAQAYSEPRDDPGAIALAVTELSQRALAAPSTQVLAVLATSLGKLLRAKPRCRRFGDLMLLASQALLFTDAVSAAGILAWHESLARLEAICCESDGWAQFICWLRAEAADDGEEGEAQWELLSCARTTWEARSARVALNAQLGSRASGEIVVALDGMVDEGMRAELLDFITQPGWDHSRGPPTDGWARATADGDGLPCTWGLKPARMSGIKALPAARELHGRLQRLFPRYALAHMPAVGDARATCTQFVGNAAVPGDTYRWHVDADPAALDPARTNGLGGYVNGTRRKPLFVSMLVYLNPEWRASWDGETLFRDADRCAGLLVQPLPGRVVLMAQDVHHRASPPSTSAPAPRYSLVWKLLFVPADDDDEPPTLRREAWGEPALL
jgi:hypothetical protein